MPLQAELDRAARRVAELLRQTGRRIVFAESCTGGLVAATLTRVPGISEFLCGSAVVYQVETKHCWLNVPESLLEDPGPVSREVAAAMAVQVLEKTPHADVAAAVTGHLGPNAPQGQDGLVFTALVVRGGVAPAVKRHQLEDAAAGLGVRRRRWRQSRAALLMLEMCREFLEDGV